MRDLFQLPGVVTMSNRFGSLFTGIGGMDKGLEDAGWECAWQVEIDPYCTAVLEKHWPNVPRFGDITEVDFGSLPAVDLLAGGFPCQPVSYAGKGKAQADHRWLWPEFARAIRALRPRLVLVENVPGLRGRGLGTVLGDLTTIGYDAEWHCVPAAALGAPHRRDRVWIVAYPQRQCGPGWGGTGDVAREARAAQGDSEQRERSGDAAHDRGPVVAHAYPSGLEVGDQPLLLGQRPTAVRDSWGLAEPGLGYSVDGFSRWLAGFALTDSHELLSTYGNTTETRPDEVLRRLRGLTHEETIRRPFGGSVGVPAQEILLAYLRRLDQPEKGNSRKKRELLARTKEAQEELRGVRGDASAGGTPLRSRLVEQPGRESPDSLQVLSRLLAQHAEASWMDYCGTYAHPDIAPWERGLPRTTTSKPDKRVAKLKALGNAVVPVMAEWLGRQLLEG